MKFGLKSEVSPPIYKSKVIDTPRTKSCNTIKKVQNHCYCIGRSELLRVNRIIINYHYSNAILSDTKEVIVFAELK